MLRFGVTRFAQSRDDWFDKGQRAEQCGVDVAWAPDHLFRFGQADAPVPCGRRLRAAAP